MYREKFPEAIATVQQFVVVVANAWRFAQALQSFIDAGPQTLGGSGTIFSDAEEDFPQVGFRLRGENKAPLHELPDFFLARRRSAINSRSSAKTSSPSIN